MRELLDEARGLSGDFDRLSQAVGDQVDLSSTELLAMDLISRSDSISAGELARELRLTSGAITGLVDRLEKAGFARRVHDAEDRRRVLVQATVKERKIGELYAPLAASLRRAIEDYSQRDLETVTGFIRRLRSVVADTTSRMPR
jgi:DNA-binding MarR family transcriptional regulator